jgi:hypothetical protein
MIEKYSNKNIDDKRLISIKSNLIYWSECWLFDVLQLTSIEIYLYFTIYEMNSFDVEFDSYLSRFHVVKWISRDETLRESFNRTFVLRSFAHFVIRSLKIWAWSLNRWVRLIEDLAEIIEQTLLDLRKAMRWLDVTYLYSKRRRNMILFLKIIVSVINNEFIEFERHFFIEFFFRMNCSLDSSNFLWLWIFWFSHLKWRRRCVFAFETRRHREDHDCHSQLWMFFFMREIMRFSCEKCLFFALLIVKMIISIDSKFRSSSLCDFFWNSSKAIVFHEWKML